MLKRLKTTRRNKIPRYIDADGLIRVLKSFTTYMKAEENDDVIKGLEKAIFCADEYSNKFYHRGKWITPRYDDGMSEPIYYQVRCSKCGFTFFTRIKFKIYCVAHFLSHPLCLSLLHILDNSYQH